MNAPVSGGRGALPRSAFVAPILAAAVLLFLLRNAMALECPVPQPPGAPGAIQETPSQIAELSAVLASGDLGNRIPVFVHALRDRHPDVPAGELVNYLVTAYCPVVNGQKGLSTAGKQARLSDFVSKAIRAAY